MKQDNSYEQVQEALEGWKRSVEVVKKEQYLGQLLDYLTPLIKKKIRYYFGYLGQDKQEELMQEGYLRSIELIRDFDMNRGVLFLGYMKRMLGCFFFDKRKAVTKQKDTCQFEEEYMDPANDPEYSGVEVEDWLRLLNQKEGFIIRQHVLGGRKLIRLAEEMNISYVYAKEIKRNALRKLRKDLRLG